MHTGAVDCALRRRRVDADVVRALVDLCHGAVFPAGLREEQFAVVRVIRALGYRCCGQAEFDLTGTNQFYIRVKCCCCQEICLRYRRRGQEALLELLS